MCMSDDYGQKYLPFVMKFGIDELGKKSPAMFVPFKEFLIPLPFKDCGRFVGLFAVMGVERGLLITELLVYQVIQ